VSDPGQYESTYLPPRALTKEEIEHQLRLCDKADAEERYLDYVKLMWPVRHNPETDPLRIGWVVEGICEHMEAVHKGQITKLLMNLPPGFGKPVHEDERVQTARGWIPLREVVVGDLVLTHKGRWRRVTVKHDQGVLPLVKVTTYDGRTVKAAPDHPFLTTEGWKNAGDLVPGDMLAAASALEDTATTSMPAVEARLLGYLVGDGSTQTMVGFTNANPEVLADFEHCAEAMGFRIGKRYQKPRCKAWFYPVISPGKKSDVVRAWAAKHGLWGCNSYTKRIPPLVWSSGREALANFMGAYWSCDGHMGIKHQNERKTAHVAQLTTVACELAVETQQAMLRLGVHTRLRVKHANIKTKRQGDVYTSYNLDICDQHGVALVSRLPGLCAAKRNAVAGSKRRFFQDTLWPDEVMEVSREGEGHCYCLTVEEDSTFTAAGLVVHNSILSSQLFPTWEWGPRSMPHLSYIKATHTSGLAWDHNRACRDYIESELYQQLWGDRFKITGDANAKQRFANDKAGQMYANGTDAGITGERGHRVIVDDPHTVQDADSVLELAKGVKWYFETASSRNKDPMKKVHIIVMQRLNILDLSGKILSDAKALGFELFCVDMEFDPKHPIARKRKSRIGWRDPRAVRYELAMQPYLRAQEILADFTASPAEREAAKHVMPPAAGELAFEERFDRDSTEEQKAEWRMTRGSYVESAQMQQNPIPEKGGMFEGREDDELIVDMKDVPISSAPFARGWDFAGSTTDKSPWSVGALGRFIDGVLYVYDIDRRRVDSDALDAFLGEVADADDEKYDQVHQDFPQDPAQAGKYQVKHISKTVLQGHVFSSSPEGKLDKEQRAKPLASQWNAGNVKFVRGPWNAEAKAEVIAFPGGVFKDQVDALVRLYQRCLANRKQKLPGVGKTVLHDETEAA
jgi:predicted phage terminase large subunit-like protein